jgi:hypothetical protein
MSPYQGNQAYKSKDYPRAIAFYRTALKVSLSFPAGTSQETDRLFLRQDASLCSDQKAQNGRSKGIEKSARA